MSALVVEELVVEELDLLDRPSIDPSEDVCADCGSALAEFEEGRCDGCSDLALHATCRDCGRVLRDADLDAGACTDCLA